MKLGKILLWMLTAVALVFSRNEHASAELNQWASYGPVGGSDLGSVVVDPQNSNWLYITTGSLMFKSEDGGSNWNALNPESTPGGIGQLVIDPRNSSTIYAGGSRVHKSTDHGLNWTETIIGYEWQSIAGWWILELDPRNPETIYAGYGAWDLFDDPLFKSTNGGISWRRTSLPTGSGNGIGTIAVDPQDPEVVYVGNSSELYQSMDGGETWKSVMLLGVYSIAIDPQNSATLYAGTQFGVFKSTDRGNSWRKVSALESLLWSLAIDPQGNLYASGYSRGLFKSSDGGATWNALKLGLPTTAVTRVVLDPRNSSVVYAQTGEGAFKSIDGGTSWDSINSGLTGTSISTVTADPQHSGTVFSSTGNRLLKSTDGARYWSELASFRHGILRFVTVSPQNGNVIYAGFNEYVTPGTPGLTRLFKSIDGGINWISVSLGLPTHLEVNGLTIDPLNANTLYVRMGFGNTAEISLYKSTDGGATWHSIGSNTLPKISIRTLAIDPRNANILYAQTESFGNSTPALFKSSDGGDTWRQIDMPDLFLNAFAFDPVNSGTLYAGGRSSLFKTTDGGTTWNRIPLSSDPNSVTALLVDPHNLAVVYAGTSRGLYLSQDAGTNWNRAGAGLPPSLIVLSLAADPQSPGKIYVGSRGGGVFATFPSPVLTLDTSYCIGDPWMLKVSGAPNATIRLFGTSNGQKWEVAQWKVTDGGGNAEERGTMSQLGGHTLGITVDGLTSTTLSFNVQNCRL